MPVYNGDQYIESSLNSLLRQSCGDFELIISDNASTDKTKDICEAICQIDRRVKYIRQPLTISAFENFRFVLNTAQAEYFMWAACDDLWDDEWLKSCYKNIKIFKKQTFTFGCLQFINSEGKKIAHAGNAFAYPLHSKNPLIRFIFYYLIPESFGKANLIYSLMPTSSVKTIVSSFTACDHPFADVILVARIVETLSLKQNDKSHFYKRVHPNNAGGTLFSGMPSRYRCFHVFKVLCITLPFQMIKGVTDHTAKFLMVLLWPIKIMISVCGIIYSRSLRKCK
jgi:glycosyltransferase involved in cell wall biosynthesis